MWYLSRRRPGISGGARSRTQQVRTVTQVGTSEPTARVGGRRRDPRSDTALIEAVLDLVSEGATLSGLSFVTIAKDAGLSRNSLHRRWKCGRAVG